MILGLIISSNSSAQLRVQSEHKAINKIGTLRSSYMWLYVQGSDYYINIRTSNEFDENTLFCLGENADSAIQTARDMINIINTIEYNSSVEVEDAKGVGAVFVKKKILGQPYLDIKQERRAGTSNITLKEIEAAIRLICKHVDKDGHIRLKNLEYAYSK